MKPEVKERLGAVINLITTGFHWGYIPVIVYLGFRKGSDVGGPEMSLLSILWQ